MNRLCPQLIRAPFGRKVALRRPLWIFPIRGRFNQETRSEKSIEHENHSFSGHGEKVIVAVK
jgi:hypothetical protein